MKAGIESRVLKGLKIRKTMLQDPELQCEHGKAKLRCVLRVHG